MADKVTVKLTGPVWDEDGTLYREGTREVPRALAARLGMVKGAKADASEPEGDPADGGEVAGSDAGTGGKAAKGKAAKGKGK